MENEVNQFNDEFNEIESNINKNDSLFNNRITTLKEKTEIQNRVKIIIILFNYFKKYCESCIY